MILLALQMLWIQLHMTEVTIKHMKSMQSLPVYFSNV